MRNMLIMLCSLELLICLIAEHEQLDISLCRVPYTQAGAAWDAQVQQVHAGRAITARWLTQ